MRFFTGFSLVRSIEKKDGSPNSLQFLVSLSMFHLSMGVHIEVFGHLWKQKSGVLLALSKAFEKILLRVG